MSGGPIGVALLLLFHRAEAPDLAARGAWIALAAANGFAFLLYGLDKAAARRGAGRVAERTLLLAATPGAALAAWAGVILFRHKWRKPGFLAALAALTLIELGVALALLSQPAGEVP